MLRCPPITSLGQGDELRIRVWGQVNFQSNVRVDRAGEIYIPVSQIGPVHVAGLPYSELQQHLRDAVGRVYRNFDLLADVGQIRAIQIYITGQARRPGMYTVSSLSSLVDALFASGGPSVQGSLRSIQLRRGSETVTQLDLYDFLIRGDKSKDVKLLSGDVIFIPPVGAQAAVTGSVRSPAIYELKPHESLADLIADAGGASTVASDARISIERIVNHSERHAMEVAYDAQGLGTAVADGDLVRVFSMVPKYNQTVTLRGNIANPGRFAWKAGMRVSDLIPDKESLLTRNYWWKRTQLGLPAPDFEPTEGFSRMRQPLDNNPITLRPSDTSRGYGQQNQWTLPQDQNGNYSGAQQNQYDQYGNQYPQSGSGTKPIRPATRPVWNIPRSISVSIQHAVAAAGPARPNGHAAGATALCAATCRNYFPGSRARRAVFPPVAKHPANGDSPRCSRNRLGLCGHPTPRPRPR